MNDFNKFAKSRGVSSTSLHKYTSSITPYIMEVSDQNISTMDVFSKLMLDSRIIFLGTDIDDYVANIINAQMLYLNSEQALKNIKSDEDKAISLYINSGGGCVYSGNGILDVMDMVKMDLPIKTVNTGISASMAAVILSNGTKDYRYSLKRSRVMIHQPMSFGGGGQASDIDINAKEINILKKGLIETLSDNSKQSFQKVKKDCDRDFWMSAPEAQKYGLIDKIIK